MRDKRNIQSLERGLMILRMFAESATPLTVTEVSKALGLNKATTHRFLYTLQKGGYLYRVDDKGYLLGGKILSLGFAYFNSSNIIASVKPHLDELSDIFNKTVNLAILDDVSELFLYRKEVAKFVKYNLGPGSRIPAHVGSIGKVLLAGLPTDELKRRIDRIDFQAVTPKSITSPKVLWKQLMTIREMGYAISNQELSMDLYGIAVPLIQEKGEIIAGINISSVAGKITSPESKKIIDLLMKKGKIISMALGYSGPYPCFPM
ncbi:MAG: IclR family transcriptional regulator [Thermodesulfobacteriota bacterium]